MPIPPLSLPDHLTRVSSPNLKASKTVFILASGLILIGGDRSEEEFCVIDFDESLCSFPEQRAVLIRGMVAAAESLKCISQKCMCQFQSSCSASLQSVVVQHLGPVAARKFIQQSSFQANQSRVQRNTLILETLLSFVIHYMFSTKHLS